jgi:hypothetical protein
MLGWTILNSTCWAGLHRIPSVGLNYWETYHLGWNILNPTCCAGLLGIYLLGWTFWKPVCWSGLSGILLVVNLETWKPTYLDWATEPGTLPVGLDYMETYLGLDY